MPFREAQRIATERHLQSARERWREFTLNLLMEWLPGAIPRALVVFNKQDLRAARR